MFLSDILYMEKNWSLVMKNTQLLSVILSLIMVFGVTAGSAFAQTDDVDDSSIEDEIEEIETEMEDEIEDTTDDKTEYETDRDHDRDEDHDRNIDDIFREKLAHWCEMSDEEKNIIADEYSKTEDQVAKSNNYCTLNESDRAAFIAENREEFRAHHDDSMKDKMMDKSHMNYDRICSLSESDRAAEIVDAEKLERISKWCEMTSEEREDYKKEHHDKEGKDHDKNMRDMLMRYCEMTDEDKRAFLAEHDKVEDHAEKMNSYCSLDEDARMDFIEEHKDEYKKHHDDSMKDKMMDKSHMNYDRICSLCESDRAAEIVDAEKLERISKWCEMTSEEREDYKKEHHDKEGKDHDKMDKVHDGMNMSEMSPRLKEMIMSKHDISDEKREEIKMKYIEKHGELTDERKSELKMKFKEHMASKRVNISEERRSEIHDRLSEMKAFKAELREQASGMTDEEKQELREEFLEKAKDMQLAWISPRHQMNAGIVADDIECREGFSLVMKASNGVPMCLKANTALKMIEKGIAVPAN